MHGRAAAGIQGELTRLAQIEFTAKRWRDALYYAKAHPGDPEAEDRLREAEEDHARVVNRLAS